MYSSIVPEPGLTLHPRAWPIEVLSAPVIYAMIVPLVFVDISFSLYQAVYFRIADIPMVRRSDYLLFDRGRLRGLNWHQRFNCLYCDYANGIIAWAKVVVNRTEVYSCAIKHASSRLGQEHQGNYHPYDRYRSAA